MTKQFITYEQAHQFFRYEDGHLFWKQVLRPNQVKVGDEAGHVGPSGYRGILFYGKRIRAHRVIYLMHTGSEPDEVDHINCHKDDNRIENLRAVAHWQNMSNTRKAKNNKSGIKGVHWHAESLKWSARFRHQKRTFYIGLFSDIGDASIALQARRIEVLGEFANHGDLERLA